MERSSTEMAALWDAVAPDAFAKVVEVLAAAGVRVSIEPVTEEELMKEWEDR